MEIGLAFLILLASLMLGVPIAFSFLASAAFLTFAGGFDPSFLVPYGFTKISSPVLLTIPLFIIAGGLIERGGIGERLIDLVDVFLGRLKGGLAVVSVVACALFGSLSGSSSATVSTIGTIMLPRLRDHGYPRGQSAALIASAGVLGILIPPSGLLIVYGWMGNVSILASWLATVLPGIILMILLSIVNVFLLRNEPNIESSPTYGYRTTLKICRARAVRAFPALLMPVIILGGIYGGMMTPTEGAAVSALYAILVGFLVYRALNWKTFVATVVESITITGMIMIMLFGVVILGRMWIMENVPSLVMGILTAVSTDKHAILLMVNIFMIILGMLMDDTSATLLATPIILPVVTQLGVDPIHFAAVLGVNLGMGNITPPCAPLLYLAGNLGEARFREMLAPTVYMILFAWLPTLIVTTYFPSLSLWLPGLILGH